jgi:hypothetical protein
LGSSRCPGPRPPRLLKTTWANWGGYRCCMIWYLLDIGYNMVSVDDIGYLDIYWIWYRIPPGNLTVGPWKCPIYSGFTSLNQARWLPGSMLIYWRV